MRWPCPHCADTGAVLLADGSLDACGRCARVAEAEHRFARVTTPAPPAQPAAPPKPQPARPRRASLSTRPLSRRAGAVPSTTKVPA